MLLHCHCEARSAVAISLDYEIASSLCSSHDTSGWLRCARNDFLYNAFVLIAARLSLREISNPAYLKNERILLSQEMMSFQRS